MSAREKAMLAVACLVIIAAFLATTALCSWGVSALTGWPFWRVLVVWSAVGSLASRLTARA